MLDGIFVKRRAGIDDRRFAMALASVDSAERRVIEYSQGAAVDRAVDRAGYCVHAA